MNDQKVRGRAPCSTPGRSRSSGTRTWLWLVPLAVLLVALLAGCGDDGDNSASSSGVAEGAAGPPEQKRVTVGTLPTPEFVALEIAIKKGFFEEEGVEVTTKTAAPRSAVPAVLGGSVDVTGLNWITFLTAVNRNISLRVVSELGRGRAGIGAFLVRADSDVKTLDDLVNKKVAVIATPDNCGLLALDALKQSGVDGKPKFVEFAIPDMPGALARGNVDAACVPEPLLSQLKEKEDFRAVYGLFEDEYEELPLSGLVTSAKYAEQNPNTIGALQRGLEKAFRTMRENPKIVREILPTIMRMTPKQAERTALPVYPERTDLNKLQELARLMERVGLIDKIEVPLAGSPEPK
jgi:NitT/TauT family transport system substrate-binding protein